jgi:hypothetical protein
MATDHTVIFLTTVIRISTRIQPSPAQYRALGSARISAGVKIGSARIQQLIQVIFDVRSTIALTFRSSSSTTAGTATSTRMAVASLPSFTMVVSIQASTGV